MNAQMPNFERLRADIGRSYVLDDTAAGGSVTVELVDARRGVPMNRLYACHSAEFALPPGVRLAQAVFDVWAGEECWPGLLLTPVGPGEDGRQRLQMVFHGLVSQDLARHAPSPAKA